MHELKENTFICVEDNALPTYLCDGIISFFEESHKKLEGRVIDEKGEHVVNKKAKISMDLDLSGETGMGSDIDRELFRIVGRAFNTYVDMFGVLKAFSVYDTGYFLTKYLKDEGFYDWHIDAGNDATINRLFSCLIYLNTVDYGGETEFFYQKLSVKPIRGRLLLFPAAWTHLHRGIVPVSGDKFIMTTFLTHKINSSIKLHELGETKNA